jgi:hypothetical protein
MTDHTMDEFDMDIKPVSADVKKNPSASAASTTTTNMMARFAVMKQKKEQPKHGSKPDPVYYWTAKEAVQRASDFDWESCFEAAVFDVNNEMDIDAFCPKHFSKTNNGWCATQSAAVNTCVTIQGAKWYAGLLAEDEFLMCDFTVSVDYAKDMFAKDMKSKGFPADWHKYKGIVDTENNKFRVSNKFLKMFMPFWIAAAKTALIKREERDNTLATLLAKL